MAFLIGVIILIIFIVFCYLSFKNKLKRLFGIDLNKINFKDISKIVENDSFKSIGSMDNLYLDNIKKDFNDINIKEIKRMAEGEIINYLESIQNKNYKNIKNDKIKAIIKSKIDDEVKKVRFDNINFHNTVLNRYENINGVATITIASSLEYINENNKKVQTRYKVEYIYIVDEEKVPKNKKVIGLNCPNCGSPLKKFGVTKCSYCGTSTIDVVKRTWTCNDIVEY